jgi:hypothetical protein
MTPRFARRIAVVGFFMLAIIGLVGTTGPTGSAAPSQAASPPPHTERAAGPRDPFGPIWMMLDDGVFETAFGLNLSYHGLPLIFINRFTPDPGEFPITIDGIAIQFPDPTRAHMNLVGRNIDLLVYEDSSGSGDPANANKIYQQTYTVQVADGLTFSNYQVSIPVSGPGDVYVGFSNTYDHGNMEPYSYPAPIDHSVLNRRSWVAGNVTGADPDYNDLANNLILSIIDDMGQYYAGNWVIRAHAETAIGPSSTPTPTSAVPGTATPTRTPTVGPQPTGTRGVLYDQYDHISSFYSANSQHYEPYMQTYEDFLADDFVVPAGQTWILDEVDVAGVLVGNGPVDHFNVVVHADAGLPGAPIYSELNAAYAQPTTGNYIIPLHVPAVLGPGRYWLMVQANMNYYPVGGRWEWKNRGALTGHESAWFNPGGGWGTQCTEDWAKRWMCLGDLTNPDQVFRLVGYGPAVLTPVPTTPPDTATPTATATPMSNVTPTSCAIEFTDVPPENTFYPYVRCLACKGVLGGYSDGTFRPTNIVTRGQIAKIVSNAAGFADDPGPQMFHDIAPGSTFYDYVNRLYSRGVMSGYPCGQVPEEPCEPPINRPYFRPGNNASRGQIAKIVSNAAGFNDQVPSSTQTYEDVPHEHPFWLWVERLSSRAVMGGYDCGGVGEPCVPPDNRRYFRPYNSANRGQTAKIVANTFFPGCSP